MIVRVTYEDGSELSTHPIKSGMLQSVEGLSEEDLVALYMKQDHPDHGKPVTVRLDGDDIATAYHEAGHAVIAHALDVSVGGVSIVPGDGTAGHATNEASDPEAEIVILAAGHLAACRVSEWADGNDVDELQIDALQDRCDTPVDKLRSRADAILSERWHIVTRVASWLLEHRRIDGQLFDVLADPDTTDSHALAYYEMFYRSGKAATNQEVPK